MKIQILLAIVIMIVITALCIFVYQYFTQTENNEIQNESINFSTEPIFTLENYPKVDAYLATQPLATAFVKNFTGEEEITDEELDYTNTHPGYIRLIDGEVDLIVVTEPSEDELKYSEEKNVELEVIPLVR